MEDIFVAYICLKKELLIKVDPEHLIKPKLKMRSY